MPGAWNREIEPLAREGLAVRWRGRRLDFAPSIDALAAAGVKLSRREQQSGVLTQVQALRFLCHHLDHPFFASEDALRALLDAQRFDVEWRSNVEGEELREYCETALGSLEEWPLLSCDLTLVLQTRDWCHPRFGGVPEETVTVREAFTPLAEALATGDWAIWENQNPARFNSHWSHWAETEWAAEQAPSRRTRPHSLPAPGPGDTRHTCRHGHPRREYAPSPVPCRNDNTAEATLLCVGAQRQCRPRDARKAIAGCRLRIEAARP